MAIVNNFGQPLGEEYTLVLAAEGFLKEVGKGQDIVTNLSTTIALEKMAEKNDSKVQRTAVGEINVVKRMIEIGSNIGGEGNGGVILKEAHLGRDSLVGVAMILNRLSQDADKSISEIHNTLPQFNIVKDKVQLDHIDESELIRTAKDVFINSTIDTTDGIKFIWSDKWIHLRKSNTEPIIRIYAEAPTIKDAKILIQKLKSQ